MSRLRWLTRRDALAGKFTIALTQGLALTPGLAGLMGAYMEPSCRGRSHSVGRNSGFLLHCPLVQGTHSGLQLVQAFHCRVHYCKESMALGLCILLSEGYWERLGGSNLPGTAPSQQLPHSVQSPEPNDGPSSSGEVPHQCLAAAELRVCF